MNLPLRRSRTKMTGVVIIGLSLITAVALFVIFTARSESVEAASENSRLITVHDRGEEKVFITESGTIGDALATAGIETDSRDAVEPALDEKLVAKEYDVNIYRARPVVVVDGSLRLKVVTPYQTAERIANDAGVTLYPEDVTTLSQSTNFIADGAGLELSIDRATPVTLLLHGAATQIRTQGDTVAALLKEKNITLSDADRASLPLNAPVTNNMNLRIWREGKQTVTADEAVAYQTEQIRDADRETGYKAVQTPGQAGARTVTYEVQIQDGIEVARTEIASLVTTQPVKQVEVIGVKAKTLAYTGGGSKSEWLAASNIPEESWGYADAIVTRESGWNPNAINKSSGACGLAQALPCSKVPGNPYNPVDSLNWMNGYVNGRYGGWAGAYTFWQNNHWY